MTFVDPTTARHLAWVLKTLLGLEIIIELALLLYGTVSEGSKILIAHMKLCLINPLSKRRSPWPGGPHSMRSNEFITIVCSIGDRGLVGTKNKF